MLTASQAKEFSRGAKTGLCVCLLGNPVVEWAGQPLDIARRRVRALLYRLAAAEGPVSREHLCYLLWPDVPEATARRSLTGVLAHLRRSLPEPACLATAEDHVTLLADRVWTDVMAFGRLCHSGAANSSVSELSAAVDLYRGPFLDGFSLPECREFEEWALLERYTLEQRYLRVLANLVQELAARGEHAAAIDHARRYLSTDELAEDMHRQLIDLYVQTGDRSAALRQYENCALILERELGVSPLPETQATYQAARLAQPTLRLPQPAIPAWTTLPSLDVALVGRERALLQLENAYNRALSGGGSLVLVSGEAGIGKSRLIQDFATRLKGRVLLLTGAAYPDTHMTPYAPIVEALRPGLLAHRATSSISTHDLAEVSILIPEVRLLHPELPPASAAGQLQARLFEALFNCLLGLAGRRPALLCLDDLHWADSPTLDWLIYLGRRLQGRRVLVLGTCRREEAQAMENLRRSLVRQGQLHEVELSGLDEASIVQLLENLQGRAPVDRAWAGRLEQITGGNPFFVLEILRGFIECGDGPVTPSDPTELLLPDTVRDAVALRLHRLSPVAHQVLQAGAVLGSVFDHALVQQTSGRQEVETMDGLDELVARQLLLEEPGGFRFCHEIVQAVVYRELGRWRRRMLHRRAGEVLGDLRPDNISALARHFERAEEPGRAARYAMLAGQAARKVFAHIEGRAHFERALALLAQEAETLREATSIADNRRLQIEALYGRGWALRLVGDMDTYAKDLKKVARVAESLNDAGALAHLRWREAYAHRWFCRYPEARTAAEEGVRLSREAAEPLLEAQCWREIGMACRREGDYGVARDALEKALALSIAAGDVVHQIHALGNLATLHWYLGEYQQALDLSLQSLTRCDEAGLPLERRLPLGDMGAAAAALGNSALARQCLEESLSIARQTADRTQEILCLLHLGWLSIRLKEPVEALDHLQAGLALAERIGSCTEQSWLYSGLAEAYRLHGDAPRSVQNAQRALALAEATGSVYDKKLARHILTKIYKQKL